MLSVLFKKRAPRRQAPAPLASHTFYLLLETVSLACGALLRTVNSPVKPAVAPLRPVAFYLKRVGFLSPGGRPTDS